MSSLALIKSKKGLSAVIGYLLIIGISIAMSIIVYAYLKGFVNFGGDVKCPEETSFFIRDLVYTCTSGLETLNITVKNNGRFSIDGYFIHVSNVSNPDALAVIDISSRIKTGGNWSGNSISFNQLMHNYMAPSEPTNVRTNSFNVSGYGTLYKLEIIPTRIQEENNKMKFVSCSDAKVEEILVCKY